jgi:hypothetical protein
MTISTKGILPVTVQTLAQGIPPGYFLGRLGTTTGPAQLIPIANVASAIRAAGGGGGGGGGNWSGPSVSAVGSGLTVVAGTLVATGTQQWTAGSVSAVGSGLSVVTGTIVSTVTQQWAAGSVTAIGSNIVVSGGTISATASGGGGGTGAAILLDPQITESGTPSTSAFAFKGQQYTVSLTDQTMSAIVAQISPSATAQVYQAAMLVVNNASTVITSVVALSSTIVSASTSVQFMVFPFSPSIALSAGVQYGFVVGCISGGTAFALPLVGYSVTPAFLNQPAVYEGIIRVTKTALAAGQTYDNNSASRINPVAVCPLLG